ncbi:MAG: hypothetical protein ACLQBX_19165 [Candidatus Limnocylindrales bacterium]
MSVRGEQDRAGDSSQAGGGGRLRIWRSMFATLGVDQVVVVRRGMTEAEALFEPAEALRRIQGAMASAASLGPR